MGLSPVPGGRLKLVDGEIPDTQVQDVLPLLVTKQRPARPGCQVTAEKIVTTLAEVTR